MSRPAPDSCTPDYRTRTAEGAALYLFGVTGLLVALASGKVDDLLGASVAHRVRVADPEPALLVLTDSGFTVSHLDDVLRVESERPASEITAALGAHGIWLDELSPLRADLETVFLGLTESDRLGAEGGDL